VRIGLSVPVFTADVARPMAAARDAAAAGFDGVFAPDHVFPPGRPDRPSVEATTLLAACATAVPGLGVGLLVTRAYLRPVGMLAKIVAGLDHVSGGRAIVGLGLGDANGKAEHAALGLSFPPIDERTEGLAETALALRTLFEGRPWPGGARIGPVAGPLLPPASAPVWVGGTSDRVLDVAARTADGWNGWGLDAAGFAERASSLARRTVEAGRDPSTVVPTWGGIALVGEDADDLARLEAGRAEKGLPMAIWRGTLADLRAFRDALAAAGCTWMIVTAAGPPDRTAVIGAGLRSG
jgi:alkanesulfonate monooxygenase SsuD/methylene tetrahydromethanopterin reductase-like flavin-dependent oxidoreductase (luciferase family)